MFKSINIILSFFLAIHTLSCIDDNDTINNFDSLRNETKVVLKLNKNQFDTIDSNRKINIQSGDAFDINYIKKEGDVLKINLSYGGGCAQHDFEILWDGIIYTDEPCTINLMITHNSNGDLSISYSQNGLGYGEIYASYYDIPNQNYSIEVSNDSLVPIAAIQVDLVPATVIRIRHKYSSGCRRSFNCVAS